MQTPRLARPLTEPGRRRDNAFAASVVRWQSGDAEDCKSSNAGSIPARTSRQGTVNTQIRQNWAEMVGSGWVYIRLLSVMKRKSGRDPWMLISGAIIAGAFARLPEILHAFGIGK